MHKKIKKSIRKIRAIISTSGLIFFNALLLLSGCSRPTYRTAEGMAWNTLYHITYESADDLSDSIQAIFRNIDRSLSPFNSESVVSKINNNRSDTVNQLFITVYNESRKISEKTAGAFDPTLGPLIRAWGFGQGHTVSSDTLRLDSLLALVGIGKTALRGNILTKNDPRIEFNFSALAKGFGVDCIADMLTDNEVKNFLVEVGGEIRARGLNPRGSKWSVGIDRPEVSASTGQTIMTIYLQDMAVATSGNYRNFQRDEGGNTFGHTISPTTGRPVQTDVISATVVTPLCMEADALATSCMVVGCEEALRLCNRLGAAVMLVKSDMSVETNELFRNLMEP